MYTVLIVGVLFISTSFADNEEGQLQRVAPYPPSGYRPSKAFDLPTEGGTLDNKDDEIPNKDREGKAFDGESATTTEIPMEDNVETTTVSLEMETTTTIEEDITPTTEYPDLQGNQAERLIVHPKFLGKGPTGSYSYSVQYQQW